MMPDKIAAVYALREAAEDYARVEAEIGEQPDGLERERLLDARTRLEAKTREAIETCEYCGRPHLDDEPHNRPRMGQVIEGHFGEGSARDDEGGTACGGASEV